MTRTSWREPRQRIIHDFDFAHDDSDFIGSAGIEPADWPPGSVDCIFVVGFYCEKYQKTRRIKSISESRDVILILF